jgi:hypothetical protein
VFAPERLSILFAELRSAGFTIGLIEQQRVLDLLVSLRLNSIMPDNSEQLCTMLGTVLCRTQEQQVQFRHEFTSTFGTWTHGGSDVAPPLPSPVPPPPPAPPAPSGHWGWLGRRAGDMAVRGSIVAAGFIILSGLAAYLLQNINWNSVPMAPLPDLERASPPTGPSTFDEWVALLAAGPDVMLGLIDELLGPGSLLLLLPLFAIAALWITAPGRPFSAYLRRRRVSYRPQFIELLVRASNTNIFITANFHRQAQILRRPRLVESQELDIDATLAATLRGAGVFSPVYSFRRVAPEYLIFIDRRGRNDHVAACAETLVAALRQAQVYVTVLYYNEDAQRLYSGIDSPAATLEEVASRFADHHLIIVGTGDRFFDPVWGRLHPWTELIQSFARRVIMTPVPRELWGYRERQLHERLQTEVLPLSPQAIPDLVEILAAEEPPSRAAPQQALTSRAPTQGALADLLEDRPLRWIEATTPDKSVITALDRHLREALLPEEYDWLAACAVFPELNWNVTLHVGETLEATRRRDAPAVERLLSLIHLPWFRTGEMPVWLRERLTAGMAVRLYERVRGILDDLLLTSVTPTAKNIALDLAIGRAPTTATIARAQDRLSRHMRDPILVEFHTLFRHRRIAFMLPQIVARNLIRGGLLRGLLARTEIDDLPSSARLLYRLIDDGKIVSVDVENPGDAAVAGRTPEGGLRDVTAVTDARGTTLLPPYPYYLYVPPGGAPSRLLDEPTAALYRQRRSTAWRLSLVTIALMLLLGAAFYGTSFDAANPGVAVVTVMLWLAGPPLTFHLLHVYPVVRRFELFPRFRSAGDAPAIASRKFDAVRRREVVMM